MHQSRHFAHHGYNSLAVDLPGHARSGGDLLTTVEAMADWLNEIAAQAVSRGVHFIGHSMGALIALEAAARMKNLPANNLKSVSLLGFSYPMKVSPALLTAAQENPRAAYAMMTQWSHASPIGGEPVPGFWSPGILMQMLQNSRAGTVFADLNACNNYARGERALAEIKCPLLFLCGALDKMAPVKLTKKFAAQHSAADLKILARAGHNLMGEQPDAVLFTLHEFIGRHKTN